MLRRIIRLRDGEYEIVAEGVTEGQDPGTKSGRGLRPVVAANLLHSAANEPLVARSLRRALATYLGVTRLEHRTDSDVINEFARLLATDRVVLRRAEARTAPAALPGEEPELDLDEAAPPPSPTEEFSWIEIVPTPTFPGWSSESAVTL